MMQCQSVLDVNAYSQIAKDQIRLLVDGPYSDLLLSGFGLGAMRIS